MAHFEHLYDELLVFDERQYVVGAYAVAPFPGVVCAEVACWGRGGLDGLCLNVLNVVKQFLTGVHSQFAVYVPQV